MEPNFILDSRLENDTFFVTRLALSDLRLMNDSRWPWFTLIPRLPEVEELHHLNNDDQIELFHEISAVAIALDAITGCSKINIGVLGNIVRQLHIHIVARRSDDTNWPNPVWGIGGGKAYHAQEKDSIIRTMRQRFELAAF